MFDEQLAARIADMLTTMSDLPNPRRQPVPGDLEGDFTMWFDGGAVRHDTGLSRFVFADGTTAVTGTSLAFSVTVRFADGMAIRVVQETGDVAPPPDVVDG